MIIPFIIVYLHHLFVVFGAENANHPMLVCPEEDVYVENYGTFKFPKTAAYTKGIQVKVNCEYGFRNDGFQSIYNGYAETVGGKEAESGLKRTCILRNIDGETYGKWEGYPQSDQMTVKYCKMEGWNETLFIFQQTIESVTGDTFRNILSTVEQLWSYVLDDYDCAVEFIKGMDTLLRKPFLNDVSSSDRQLVLDLVDTFSQKLAANLKQGFKTQVGDGGIFIETARFYGLERFTKYSEYRNDLLAPSAVSSYFTNFSALGTASIDISISSEALLKSMLNVPRDQGPQLKITAYSNELFKALTKESKITTDSTTSSYVEESYLVDGLENCTSTNPCDSWGILQIELDGIIENLTQPIEFDISNFNLSSQYQMKCVYWDNSTESWSTEGLETIPHENGVKCKSTHLTAFSALIEPLPLPVPDSKYAPINNSIHAFILSILSSIGSVCSIIGLGFTLLTYGLFRCLRRERSNRILINLCASLLLMHIVSISGSKSLWDDHCFFPAVSLHYLVLTSLAWMMVEAVHMYQLLISVFVRPENKFLIKRCAVAWGIPLVIVGVCAAIHPNVYQVGRASLCLMSAHENIVLYYLAYIFPICLMLLINITIFIRVFRVLYQQSKRKHGSVNGQQVSLKFVKISPSQIKGATTVMVLLGIGWVFGLVAMGPFEVFFRYMYCVCNAGQGLLIFIFRVLLNPQASKQWKKVLLGMSSEGWSDTSDTTTTTGSGSGRGMKRKSTAYSPNFISASNSVENSLTASNPLSTTLASNLASILKSENVNAKGPII